MDPVAKGVYVYYVYTGFTPGSQRSPVIEGNTITAGGDEAAAIHFNLIGCASAGKCPASYAIRNNELSLRSDGPKGAGVYVTSVNADTYFGMVFEGNNIMSDGARGTAGYRILQSPNNMAKGADTPYMVIQGGSIVGTTQGLLLSTYDTTNARMNLTNNYAIKCMTIANTTEAAVKVDNTPYGPANANTWPTNINAIVSNCKIENGKVGLLNAYNEAKSNGDTTLTAFQNSFTGLSSYDISNERPATQTATLNFYDDESGPAADKISGE